MQAMILNFTRILEKNPKIYMSIIAGIVLSLCLFIAEAVHIQQVAQALATQDQDVLGAVIKPLSDRYGWARMTLLIAAVIFSHLQYRKTKKALGL